MNVDEKFRFAFVSNSMEIAEIVKAFSDPDRENIEISLATMEEAIPVAEKLLQEGIEVILGGGATGKLLHQSLNQPVVCIARSDLDILRGLRKAIQHGKFIGLNSFGTPTAGVEIFEDLLSIRIRQLVFSSTPELVNNFNHAKDEGVECIIGDGISKKIALSMGLKGVIIYPGQEVILRALEDARTLAIARRKERRQSERMRIIIEAISEGVIGIDNQERVNILNRTAADLLNLDPREVLGRRLPEALMGTGMIRVLESGERDIDQIRRAGSTDIVINSLPMIVNGHIEAVVATFKPLSRMQNLGKKLKTSQLTQGFVAKYTLNHLKGESSAMRSLRVRAGMFAKHDTSIMIIGETGTGKEILAQGIHNASPFRNKPFVAVNCSALPETLLESELFGYEEGAFTGARRGGKAGLFEMADGGSIFLDEIADVPKGLQVRLLRVLEEKEIMRVGGDRIIPVNVRIISSTHRELSPHLGNADFRSDLYFRLAVLRLTLPPLRGRLEDLETIINELLHKHGAASKKVSPVMRERFKSYSWPGNIRELEALLKRYIILLEEKTWDDDLLESLFQELCFDETCSKKSLQNPSVVSGDPSPLLRDMVACFEKEVIRESLRDHSFNRREAARSLGISVNTLWRKAKELQKT